MNTLHTVIRGAIALSLCAAFAQSHAQGQATGPSPADDLSAPANSPALMPAAQLGSEYPTHGNRQAGEMNLNPADPRAQLANGLPNNAESGGYGSALAGVRTSPAATQ